MEKSTNYNFNLPNSANDEIADINDISDNFRIIDEKLKIDQTFSETSEKPQSGKAIAEEIGKKQDYFADVSDDSQNRDINLTDKNGTAVGQIVVVPTEGIRYTNVLTPENETDGVNKKYVDDTSNNVKSYVNNNFANALKGNTSGEVVRLNDVSPIEHEIKIKLTAESNYSDFSGVTLKRYGKNLLPYPYKNTNIDYTFNGINYKVKSDGTVVANGTATAQSYFTLAGMVLNKGVYYLSGCPSGGEGSTYSIYFQYDNFSYYKADYGSGVKIDVNGKKNCGVVINIGKNTTVSNLIFKPMLEVGSKLTDFEERRTAVAYTPAVDGTVSGVKSLYPTTTLMTDTEGVIINAEYNRDINKAFAELQQAIISLGGNV